MDRRETLKTLLVGGVAGAALGTGVGCNPADQKAIEDAAIKYYGRTPAEIETDKQLHDAQFFADVELRTLEILCDIILPATSSAGSARGRACRSAPRPDHRRRQEGARSRKRGGYAATRTPARSE